MGSRPSAWEQASQDVDVWKEGGRELEVAARRQASGRAGVRVRVRHRAALHPEAVALGYLGCLPRTGAAPMYIVCAVRCRGRP